MRRRFVFSCMFLLACGNDAGPAASSAAPPPAPTAPAATPDASSHDVVPWENPGCSEAANVIDSGLELALQVDLARAASREYGIHERVTVHPAAAGTAISLFGTALRMGRASHGYAYDGQRATFCTGAFAAGDAVTVDVDYVVSEAEQNFPADNLAGIHVWKQGARAQSVVGAMTSPFFASTWLLVPQSMPWIDADHAGNVTVNRVALEVVAPDASWSVVGPGRAQVDGAHFRYAIDHAMPLYTVSFAASESYVHVDGTTTAGGVPLAASVFPGSRAAAADRLQMIGKTVDWMGEHIGPFPWSGSLTFAEIPGFAGGMEHTAGMWIGTPVMEGADADYVAAHESIHHWWGNDVRIAGWRDFWLNEGLVEWTTVFAVLEALGTKDNAALQASYRTEAAEMSYAKSGPAPGPLHLGDESAFATQAASNLLYFYRYGAAFLEMIDQRLRRGGSLDLVPLLHDWFAKKDGRAVTTEEFRDFLIARTGDLTLRELFEEWAERGPCPTLELGSWSFGVGSARFELRRTGGAGQALESVEVVLATANGVHRKTVTIPAGVEPLVVTVPVPSAPTAIAIDPEGQYVLRLRAASGWAGPSYANVLP